MDRFGRSRRAKPTRHGYHHVDTIEPEQSALSAAVAAGRRREVEYRRRMEILPRFQLGDRKVWLVGAVREMLRL